MYYTATWKINFNPLSAALSLWHFEFWLLVCFCWTNSRKCTLSSFIFTKIVVKFSVLSQSHGLKMSRYHINHTAGSHSGLNAEHCPPGEITLHKHNICWHLVSIAKRSVSVFLIMTCRIIPAFVRVIVCGRGASYKGLTVSFGPTWSDLSHRPAAPPVGGNVRTLKSNVIRWEREVRRRRLGHDKSNLYMLMQMSEEEQAKSINRCAFGWKPAADVGSEWQHILVSYSR